MSAKYFELGMEATDWITSFQVTPVSSGWGIPYSDQRLWGLDPYYYSNGTITADTTGIKGGDRQKLAFLIGGHDAGLGASAALAAYLFSKNDRYLRIFQVYYDHFERSQLPTNASQTQAQATTNINGHNETLDNTGFWAEQATVAAGQSGIIGNVDNVQLAAVFPAAEHGNPIAESLIAYYRLTHNSSALAMLNKYGSWLVRTQIKNGQYAGAFPVTQYYWLLGWTPRMFETTESAWILCELYRVTGNDTYLHAAIRTGDYMLSRQFLESDDRYVQGALPYEWNRTQYSRIVTTNHAGFTIRAWTDLYRLTGNIVYLTAAQRYASWLLNMQVTSPDMPWGDHRYANDSMAVGGYYYGYDTDRHDFGSRAALSLWSAAHAISGLLALSQLVNETQYLQSAHLAADWLAKMRFMDQTLVPLQSLSIIKYVLSSWWGKYPQFYQPDMHQIEKTEMIKYVNDGRSNPSVIANPHPSWFERTFGLDFNVIDYQMASRGPKYMKMIWSWWPNVGFEPRYGGDIAAGSFAMANFLAYGTNVSTMKSALETVQQGVRILGSEDSPKIARKYSEARELLNNCTTDFEDGWYSIAVAKLEKTNKIVEQLKAELKTLDTIQRLKSVNRMETASIVAFAVIVATVTAYLSIRLVTRRGKRRRRK